MPPRFWTIGSWCLSQSRASTEGHTHNTLEQLIALFAANPEGASAQWKGKRGGRIEKEAPRDWWTPSERREGTRGAGANAERKTGGLKLRKEPVPTKVGPAALLREGTRWRRTTPSAEIKRRRATLSAEIKLTPKTPGRKLNQAYNLMSRIRDRFSRLGRPASQGAAGGHGRKATN